MNANELADILETATNNLIGKEYELGGRAINLYTFSATMLRQQQSEIEALKNGLSSAYWHDTFVEVKKPNSDLIYRFKLDDVCKHGVNDGACKECYMEAQEK